MSPLKQDSRFWGACFILWFIILNMLSHGDRFHPPGGFMFDIPHFDKVVHFGSFLGGGGLLAASLYFRRRLPWKRLILTVTVMLSLVGIMDEFHQSFFENRTGNDPGDWLADTLGAFFGALMFRKLHRLLA